VIVPRTRRRRGRNVWVGPLVLLFVLGLTAAGAWFLFRPSRDPDDGYGERMRVIHETKGNFTFKEQPRGWKDQPGIAARLRVNLALRNGNSACCTGLAYSDYENRMPSDAELVEAALVKLRGYLKGLEWELKPRTDGATLGGQPAVVLEFEGEDPEHVTVNGECCAMASRGYGYWFFTWGPLQDRDLLRAEWERLRQDFALLDRRPGWQENPRRTLPLAVGKGRFRLDYVEGLWAEEKKPQDHDKRAEKVLIGHDPREQRHAGKAAWLYVLLLQKDEDARDLKVEEPRDLKGANDLARAYLLRRMSEQKGEGAAGVAPVKDRNGADLDRDADLGLVRGHLAKLRVTFSENSERYVVLGVVDAEDAVLALVFECDWARRDFWEQEFTPLWQTLSRVQAR
jgi:hypothetical protein